MKDAKGDECACPVFGPLGHIRWDGRVGTLLISLNCFKRSRGKSQDDSTPALYFHTERSFANILKWGILLRMPTGSAMNVKTKPHTVNA